MLSLGYSKNKKNLFSLQAKLNELSLLKACLINLVKLTLIRLCCNIVWRVEKSCVDTLDARKSIDIIFF